MIYYGKIFYGCFQYSGTPLRYHFCNLSTSITAGPFSRCRTPLTRHTCAPALSTITGASPDISLRLVPTLVTCYPKRLQVHLLGAARR